MSIENKLIHLHKYVINPELLFYGSLFITAQHFSLAVCMK